MGQQPGAAAAEVAADRAFGRLSAVTGLGCDFRYTALVMPVPEGCGMTYFQRKRMLPRSDFASWFF
jgi:hypothetical protein